MRTITFYSYKGGVGRTLTLANIAHYLSRLGQRVVAVDLDLEAPGLHYKLPPKDPATCRGVVDLITAFLADGSVSLEGATCMVKGSNPSEAGAISIVPAGSLRAGYWDRLAAIPWHRFLTGGHAGDAPLPSDGRGLEFFLTLKAEIARSTQADYLLLDARTGITDLGGLAASHLADDLVCLLAHNKESLDGTAAVIRSVLSTPRIVPKSAPAEPLRIFPVLVRLPRLAETDERTIVERVSSKFDCTAAGPVEPLMLVHSHPTLQIDERLLITEDSLQSDSLLFADYVRLFNRILPPVLVEEDVARRTEGVRLLAYDDPDKARELLETVADRFPHPISYRALLKFYRLRSIFNESVLDWTRKLVDLTQEPDEAIVWSLVRSCLEEIDLADDPRPDRLAFVESVWSSQGAAEWTVGLELSSAYGSAGESEHAQAVVRTVAEKVTVDDVEGVTEILRALLIENLADDALRLVERCTPALRSPEIQRLTARAAVQADSSEAANHVLETDGIEQVLREDAALRVRLYRVAGRGEELITRARVDLKELVNALRRDGLSKRGEAQLRQLHRQYAAMDRADEMWRVVHELPSRPADAARLRDLEKQLSRDRDSES